MTFACEQHRDRLCGSSPRMGYAGSVRKQSSVGFCVGLPRFTNKHNRLFSRVTARKGHRHIGCLAFPMCCEFYVWDVFLLSCMFKDSGLDILMEGTIRRSSCASIAVFTLQASKGNDPNARVGEVSFSLHGPTSWTVVRQQKLW